MKPLYNIGDKLKIVHDLSRYPCSTRQLYKTNGYLIVERIITCEDNCSRCRGYGYTFVGDLGLDSDGGFCEHHIRKDTILYKITLKKPKKFRLKKNM